jgi:hypothetical protein
MLRGLQVKKRFMIGLIATFGSGMVTVATSVSRFTIISVIKEGWTNVCKSLSHSSPTHSTADLRHRRPLHG